MLEVIRPNDLILWRKEKKVLFMNKETLVSDNDKSITDNKSKTLLIESDTKQPSNQLNVSTRNRQTPCPS